MKDARILLSLLDESAKEKLATVERRRAENGNKFPLPVELLAMIFTDTVDTAKDDMLKNNYMSEVCNISLSCRLFSQLLKSSPAIWTTLRDDIVAILI